MKKLILSGFLIFTVSLAAISQPYHSLFAKDTTQWNVSQLMTDLVETNLYYSATDSVIGDKHYHTIFHQINGSVNDPIGKNSSVCGFVREDTVNGKFWFLNSFADTTIEVLLMDLSLDKGDTFVFIHDYRYMWKDSVTVDSVFHENNRKIIALNKTHFDGFGESKIWFIEGIGPNTGFLWQSHIKNHISMACYVNLIIISMYIQPLQWIFLVPVSMSVAAVYK